MWRLPIFLTLLLVSLYTWAQDDPLSELSMDELIAVDLNKHSLPIAFESGQPMANAHNIGMVLPLSKFEDFSRELIQAAKLACEEINAAGGALDSPLQLIIADDASESTIAIRKVDTLISQFGVNFLIGPTGSGRFIDVVEHLEDPRKLLMISPSATSAEITRLADAGMAFRTAASDEMQATVAADYAVRVLGKQKAAIFSIDNSYGQGLAINFKQKFQSLGGLVVAQQVYSPLVDLNVFDVSPRIEKLMGALPDMLYVIANDVDLGTMATVFGDLEGLKSDQIVLFATDAAKGEALLKERKVYEGVMGASPAFTTDEAFLQRYETRFGQRPTFLEVADVYDIVYLIALGMEVAWSSDPVDVATALPEVSRDGELIRGPNFSQAKQYLLEGRKINLQGVSGDLAFDYHGDILSREFEIWQLKDGKFQVIKEVHK